MLSKKSLFIFLFLFNLFPLYAIEYFIVYKGEKFEIAENVLKKSKMFWDLWEEYKEDEESDDDYNEFYDEEGNFKIPLEPFFDEIKLPNGQPLINIVSVNDIKNFIKLSNETLSAGTLNTQELITLLNVANVFDNKFILNDAAEALAEKIKSKKELLNFLKTKGIIWEAIKKLPKDILESVLKEKLFTTILTGHTDEVTTISWSSDGKRIASGSKDNTIRIWNIKNNKTKKELSDYTNDIISLSWSPDGTCIAYTSRDKTVRIWNIKTGRIKKFTNFIDDMNSISWSPDGNKIVTESDGQIGCIRILNIQELSTKKSIIHTDWIYTVAWSPTWSSNGRIIAAGTRDSTILIYNPQTHEVIKKKKLGNQVQVWSVIKVVWSPDGKKIAAILGDMTIKVWNLQTGQLKTLSGHTDDVHTLSWSPDGKRIASGSKDKTIRIWKLKTGKIEKVIPNDVEVYSVAWSPDGTMIASNSKDGTIRIINNLSFKQAVTMLALEARYKTIPWYQLSNRAFSIEKNKEIFKIIKTLPIFYVFLMKKRGWIKFPKKNLKK